MKRRIALRRIVLISAGAALLDACTTGAKETPAYKNVALSEAEEDLLASLTEAIIPTTPDFVGAKALASDQFILVMVDDCAGPDDQKAFLEGMRQFDEACMAQTGSSFASATAEQQKSFLTIANVREGNELPEAVTKFYRTVRRMTIQCFTSSQEFLTKVRNFSLIPPKFQACVPVENV